MQLSLTERWILFNQFKILEKLYPEEADFYQRAQEIIENGYELNYSWLTSHIDQDTMTADECKLVLDILSMFSLLSQAYENLPDKSEIEEHNTQFLGFHANTESKYYSYASFLIDREHKFIRLRHDRGIDSFGPTLDRYSRMLREWKKSNDPNNLTEDDIKRIASA